MKNNEIIIALTHKTSKLMPRIFCRHFRHCAVIFVIQNSKFKARNEYIFVQIAIDGVRIIPFGPDGLACLEKQGWTLIKTHAKKHKNIPKFNMQFLTCVGFAKRVIGINNPFIWTPDALYKKLMYNVH